MMLSEELALRHWELEKTLTQRLLQSTPEARWETFEECYTTLYAELPWLNQIRESGSFPDPDLYYSDWLSVIGSPPKRVYEVGSGKGSFVKYLAGLGYDCTGTDVTRERGKMFDSGTPGLKWGITDGVHLARFERPGTYDIVISDQLIEHLHPDDLVEHFQGALAILKTGGSYIFRTPHYCFGPSDVSRIFKCEKSEGMHLKEYTYQEIVAALRRAGFDDVRAIPSVPYIIRGAIGLRTRPRPSSVYLKYLLTIEKVIKAVPYQPARYTITFLSSALLIFRADVFVCATKN
jgi:SAM-dependent methyltransferase